MSTLSAYVAQTQFLLHDPNAQVTRWHDDERAYALLHELNTRPRTRHLARIKNLNPEIPA